MTGQTPIAAASALHEEIDRLLPRGQIAVGLRYSLLVEFLDDQIRALPGTGLQVPTPDARLSVSVSRPAQNGLTFRFDPAQRRLTASGVVTVNIHVPGVPTQSFRKHNVTYDGIQIQPRILPASADSIAFSVQSIGRTSSLVTQEDRTLMLQHFQSEAEYYAIDAQIMFNSIDRVGRVFVESIPIPPVVESLRAIKLGTPIAFAYADEYLLTYSESVLFEVPTCVSGADARHELALELKETDRGVSVATTHLPRSPSTGLVSPQQSVDDKEPLVLFIRKKPLVDYHSKIVAPALAKHKDGRALLFYWYYNATVALDGLNVALRGALSVSSQFGIWGMAGAGVDLGCTKVDVVDARMRGRIDPLNFDAIPYIAVKERQLRLRTSATDVNPVVDWEMGLPLPWPLSDVASLIMQMVTEGPIRDGIARSLNSFRITLLDLGSWLTRYLCWVRPDYRDDSVMYALVLSREECKEG